MGESDKRTASRDIIILLIYILICLILVFSSAIMMTEYTRDIEKEASSMGIIKSNDIAAEMRGAISTCEDRIAQMRTTILSTPMDSESSFASALRSLRRSDDFSDLMFSRYFKDGVEYTLGGSVYDQTLESDAVLELIKQGSISCAGVVDDREYSISAVAFCVSLEGCPYADSVVFFFPVSSVVSMLDEKTGELLNNSRVAGIITEEGVTVSAIKSSDIELKEHNNFFDVLKPYINDKKIIDSLRNQVSNGNSYAYPVNIYGESHILSVSSIKEGHSNPFAIISLYKSDTLEVDGYSTIRTILGALMVFFILLIFISLFTIINRKKSIKKFSSIHDTDKTLDCPTRIKFERVAADILSRNKATAFAVVVIDLRHYKYLSEQIDKDIITAILLYLKILYTRMLRIDETMGYLGEGKFVLLLHYRDEKDLSARLRSTIGLASAYNGNLPKGYALSLFGGIYCTDRGITSDISKMISMANDAKDAYNFPYDFSTFRLYNENLHNSNAQAEYIEVHMEQSLINNEFQVFYQPKYNIANDRPDGCEALVRWYNPERNEYMQPGVFIPLFEANRFIIKLDKYIYEQVCKYIENAVSHGQPLYPVSVNVSRITASSSDFLDYYIKVKNEHNIADGFITIEFTESFAYEDYEMLRQIINTLHQNGFKCSIDDFGSGFSSYNILKELPMDEIKLDRFFIDKGISADRDLIILSSVINIGRGLNMKVTQEGVETIEQLNLLKKLGCHVIQGYHYSKPLTEADYVEFLEKQGQKDVVFTKIGKKQTDNKDKE